MRFWIVVFLLVALTVSSLMAVVSLPAEYLVSPAPYAIRLKNVVTAVPFEKHSFEEYTETTSSVASMRYDPFVWQKVSVEGITDIPEALKVAANNIGGFMGNFFTNVVDNFGILWHNLSVKFSQMLGVVKCVAVNAYNAAKGAFSSREWLESMKWAILPIDWQTYQTHIAKGNVSDAEIFGEKVSKMDFDTMFGKEWKDILAEYAEGHRGGR